MPGKHTTRPGRIPNQTSNFRGVPRPRLEFPRLRPSTHVVFKFPDAANDRTLICPRAKCPARVLQPDDVNKHTHVRALSPFTATSPGLPRSNSRKSRLPCATPGPSQRLRQFTPALHEQRPWWPWRLRLPRLPYGRPLRRSLPTGYLSVMKGATLYPQLLHNQMYSSPGITQMQLVNATVRTESSLSWRF